MPFLFVYQATDFIGGLPDESGAAAAGTGLFTLTLAPDAQPIRVEVTDDDAVFDEVDGSQTLSSDATINGVSFGAGTSINTAYDLTNTSTGHQVTSLHLGGNGYQQGAVDGLVSTEPLQPGTSYTFNAERTSHRQNNLYDDFVTCFAEGTLITTAHGQHPVESLQNGAPLMTLDHGAQPLLMRVSRRLSGAELLARPKMRPILIRSGALGQGCPQRDLRVSPQHRMLARSAIVRRMFGVSDVLIAANKLTGLPGIDVDTGCNGITYHHLVMARHELIEAEGVPTESFYIGPNALQVMPSEVVAEMRALFPDLRMPDYAPTSARLIAQGHKQASLIARHAKNAQPILSVI